MSGIWFTVTEKFSPKNGAEWDEYYAWANIPQLKEVISIGANHKAKELWDLIAADWDYNIHMDYLITFFWDLNYLLERFSARLNEVNILAVSLEPSQDVCDVFDDARFSFQGYDLAGTGDFSAITNCGGFDKAFQANDISEIGLFNSYSFARDVQKRLRKYYPNDPDHADTELWAIWKFTGELNG
jgi:hypothetical protein